MKRCLGLFFLLSSCLIINAQPNFKITRVNEFYSFVKVVVNENSLINLFENIRYTSLKIIVQQPSNDSIQIGFKKPDGSLNYLTTHISDFSDEGLEGTYSTQLKIFESAQTRLNIDFKKFKGQVKIILIYAPELKNPVVTNLFKTTDPCDKPQMISYTFWREGLPNPKPPREQTKVEHLVVHHSAGSNSDTNYINTVRNIYLLHTQTNGWDDIGYNFLVAPNGIIFKGRDPQGVADEDNILGAHFCGKNSSTMGVCMMGDFMKQRPTLQAIFSLKYLLAWKLKKDGINAFGQTKHPQPNGSLLNNLCGHRDGCNTDCPGDSLYALLPKIKAEAARIADSCSLILSNNTINFQKQITLFPNPGSGTITISSEFKFNSATILIYSLAGNLIYQNSFDAGIPFDLTLPEGLYFYKINYLKNNFHKGILVIQN
ncbi:MAG: N-acetylmuramoyl-L-alanine amidase [Bacteroidia bacterium]